ncbi:hypothetical protein JTE90_002018 [Oedothorax gibbosus]|uniref:Uncharacterized protein n=1 Tax=Oedothorax gibbosus TaxID=931172 RepID=A0AAV6UNW3_9ARAC|nr:hypothetical protein JTE90_002018 [Oedothorax gibbosus]
MHYSFATLAVLAVFCVVVLASLMDTTEAMPHRHHHGNRGLEHLLAAVRELPTKKKMFSFAKIAVAAVISVVVLVSTMVPTTEAMPHHNHNQGFGGLEHLLAAGIIAKLFQNNNGGFNG